jgi:hypothetical protein
MISAMGRTSWPARLAITITALSLAVITLIGGSVPAGAEQTPAAATTFTVKGALGSVVALSADNAWAVGYSLVYQQGGNFLEQSLILHWNGRKWSRVTNPKPVTGFLFGVSAAAADDVWAVGFYEPTNPKGASHSLVMHWNGKVWRTVAAPSVAALLAGVAASGKDVWAVGGTASLQNALVLHWTGRHWYVVPTPAPSGALLNAVAAVGGAVWAVGGYLAKNGTNYGLVMRWSGTLWKTVSSPLQGANNSVYGIGGSRSGTAWAVGEHYTKTSSTTVSMVWNGKTWRNEPTPPLPAGGALQAAATGPGGTAWAVGYDINGALILHWTNGRWTQAGNPETGKDSKLFSVAATSVSNAWAVGSVQSPTVPDYTLILHWNGKTWS